MKYAWLVLLFTTLALPGSGCKSHTVRPGIWELSYDLRFERTGEEATGLIPPREVHVLVDRGGGGDIISQVEISPVDLSSDLARMYGDITEDNLTASHKIKITHSHDPDWIWNMWGLVRNPQQIEGTNCMARGKFKNVALTGRWDMRWVRAR